jgi:2-polyprenyl-3-methyl-5-hydroxy-6-metoxy-1,4-benzoquinol methylase
MRVTIAEQDAANAREAFGTAMEASVGALSEIRAIRQEVANGRSALGQLIDAAKAVQPNGTKDVLENVEDPSLDSLYVAFENRFRGSTTEIARRAERYLPILRITPPVASGNVVLDIGCGRGEFLAFLQKNNFVGRGIDLNAPWLKRLGVVALMSWRETHLPIFALFLTIALQPSLDFISLSISALRTSLVFLILPNEY